MDFSLLLYIGMLALGVLVGSRKSVRSRKLPWLGRLQSVALIALIAVFALAGSLLAVTLVRRLLGLDSQGRTSSQREEHEEEVKGA